MTASIRLPFWARRWLAHRLALPLPRKKTLRQSRRAAIYKVDRLGDFVLATGALHTLFRHFGAEHCRLIVSEVAAPLAAVEFPTVERWVIPAQAAQVWREIRPLRARLAPIWTREKFTHLVCLRHARALHHDVTLSWLDAEEWHGLGKRPGPESLNLDNRPELPADYPSPTDRPWCRELAAHRTVLTQVLGADPGWAGVQPRIQAPAISPQPEIVLCPFGSEPIRDYSHANWATAWRTALPHGTTVRLVGPAERRHALEQLAHDLRAIGATATTECDLAPLEFVHRIATARMVLTVDSAAAHLATVFDRPAVIVFGGGHLGEFVPWGDSPKQQWVSHPLACFGCGWQCCRQRVECLSDIAPSLVAQAIREVFDHA